MSLFSFIRHMAICTIKTMFSCAYFHQHLIDNSVFIVYNKRQDKTNTGG